MLRNEPTILCSSPQLHLRMRIYLRLQTQSTETRAL